MGQGDYSTLEKFLHINWYNILDPSHSSVDTMWERFKFIMKDNMNKYIPKVRPSRTRTHKHCQPFTAQLRALIREKHKLWNRWMNSREAKIFKKYKAVRSSNQFGFKKSSSCGHAIYSVRKVVEHYVASGSTVNEYLFIGPVESIR